MKKEIWGETLGRYELIDVQRNHSKFYHVWYSKEGQIVADYGRIGATHPTRIALYSESEAARKINEKKKKGYVLVPGSDYSELQKVIEHLETQLVQVNKEDAESKPKKRL